MFDSSSGIRHSLHGIELHCGLPRRRFGIYLSVSEVREQQFYYLLALARSSVLMGDMDTIDCREGRVWISRNRYSNWTNCI